MIPRRLRTALISIFAIAVTAFLAGNAYTQWYLHHIDGNVRQIADNANPTIVHVAHIRVSVGHLRAAVVTLVHAFEIGASTDVTETTAAMKNVEDELARYYVDPAFPQEAALSGDMQRECGGLLVDAQGVIDAVSRRDLEAARDALTRARVAVDGLDRLLLGAITINAEQAQTLAADIGATRRTQHRLNFATTLASVVLSLAAMVIGLLALGRYAATLRTAEHNFDLLLAASPEPMLLERDGCIVKTNDACEKLLAAVGHRSISQLIDPDALRRTPNDARTSRIPIAGPLGEKLQLDVWSVTLEGGQRPVRAFLLRDVTSQLALEAQLIVSDRLASIGTLAAGIGHEINNPLGYVLGNVVLAKEELERGETGPEIGEMLEDAVKGAERIRDIVRDVSMLARGDRGEMEIFDPRAVLEASANIAGAKLRSAGHLVKDFGAIPSVRGSASRLGQVALNLLVNAVHATDDANRQERRIRISTRTSDAGEAVIEIEDNGPGIDPKVRDRLFDPFFTTKSAGRGTGLGLAICHSIVSVWAGRIEVDTVLGKGTTFRVVLPAAS